MNLKNEKLGASLLLFTAISVIIAFFIVEPIAQDPSYHHFSDSLTLVSLPNALNVLSNLPFFIVGIIGLSLLKKEAHSLTIVESNKLAYIMLYLGSALVGLGSSYYHLAPNNDTLLWDRIPMTIAFMGLYAVIISEFISEKWGKLLLLPLIMVSIASVLYWWFSEQSGAGDLRYYAVAQFFPMLTIPIILIFYRSKFNGVSAYWLLIISYAAAKLCESFDVEIHQLLGVVSGHSIKHVFPAIGLYIVLRHYQKRLKIA
ncbi:MAG: alkaline phytoceramidase [Gammaproteobacteria bacterium]|nr:MAG: alkaline phytoceramidase [Gammaproteobacteria bacterium]